MEKVKQLRLTSLVTLLIICFAPLTTFAQNTTREPFEQTFRHATADVNGVRIHYVIGGSGDPLVLLHGWPETWYSWREIMPELAQRYTVIAPDLRGLGDSSKPASGYDLGQVADDIYKVVTRLGYGRIYLAGHDWGAATAYVLAATHPEIVQRLVLLDSPIPGFDFEDALLSEPGNAALVWFNAFQQVADLPEALVAGREEVYLQYFYDNFSYNLGGIGPEEVAEYARAYSQPGGMRAGFEYYRSAAESAEQVTRLAQTPLEMPVLALGGEHFLGEAMGEVLSEVAFDVQGGVVPDAHHFVVSDNPAFVAEQLVQFLNEDAP